MTDAEYEAFVAKIQGYFDKWTVILGLSTWYLTYKFSRGPIPDDDDGAMNCSALWEYKSATICVSASKCEGLLDSRLEWYAVHEFMHALTMAIDDKNKEVLTERVVSDLTSAALRAYSAGQEAAKKKEVANES